MADLAIVGDGITARLAAAMLEGKGVDYDLFCAPMSPVGSAASLSRFMTAPYALLYDVLPEAHTLPRLWEYETYVGDAEVYAEKSQGGESFGIETDWREAVTHEDLWNHCTRFVHKSWIAIRCDKTEAMRLLEQYRHVLWTHPHWVLSGDKPKYRHNFYTIAKMGLPVDMGNWLMRICDGRPESPYYKYTVWRGKEVMIESGNMLEGFKPLPKYCGTYSSSPVRPYPAGITPIGRVATGDPEWLLVDSIRRIQEVLNEDRKGQC